MVKTGVLIFFILFSFQVSLAQSSTLPNTLVTLQRLTTTPPDSIKVNFNKTDWYYIAWTKATDLTGIIYINGEPVYTGLFQNDYYSHDQIHIAARFFTEFGSFFNGQIDELRVSNRTRSSTEIKDYYLTNQPFSADANTVALWHFDEGTGSAFNNTQGGSGQLVGGPVWVTGKFGTAIDYDGLDDRGQTNFDPPESNTTYEFWVKFPYDLTESKTLVQAYSYNNYDMMVHPYVEPNTAPSNIFVSSSSILENLIVGSTVSTLTANDAEGGLISYSLVNGAGDTDNASFSINGDQLKTAAAIDYETKSSYHIRIRATDSGGLFFEKEFTVSVSAPPNTLVTLQRLTSMPPDSIKVNFNKTDWYYIAWTKATDLTGIIYINGEPVYTGLFQNDYYSHDQIHIAARFFTQFSNFFNGQIDELRVSNRTRSSSEIKDYYLSNQTFSADVNTVALWHFDEGTGNSFGNTQGGSGQLVGGPTWVAGKFGTAINYDGIDDRGQTNFDPPENNTTYEFWVKFPYDPTESKTLVQAYSYNNYDMMVHPYSPKQQQVITFPIPDQKTYGDEPFVLTATSDSGLGLTYTSSDPNVAAVSDSVATIKAAGTVVITASQAGNNRYGPALPVQQTLTINKAILTVAVGNKSIIYGDEIPAFTISYTGLKKNEITSVIDVKPTATTTATQTSSVGSYSIVPAGGSDNNYDFSYIEGVLTITKAKLIVTAIDTSRTYGDVNPDFTITYTGFKNSESSSVFETEPTATTIATQKSNVGAYNIVPAGGVDDNYDFKYFKGVLTITKAMLMATADNKTRGYGEINPAFTITYDGFKNKDNSIMLDTLPAVTTAATQSSSLGIYSISISGGADNNYNFNYTFGELTIVKQKQTVAFELPEFLYQDQSPYPLVATSSSKLDVRFSVVTGNTTIVGGNLVLGGPGSITIKAYQEGTATIDYAETIQTTTVKESYTLTGFITKPIGVKLPRGLAKLFFIKGGLALNADVIDGYFEMKLIRPGDYILQVVPLGDQATDVFPTNYVASQFHKDATVITIEGNRSITMEMIGKPNSTADQKGKGVIKGSVKVQNGSGSRIVAGRIAGGNGAASIPVYLLEASTSKIKKMAITDLEGNFEMPETPSGKYRFAVDVVGVMLNESSIELDFKENAGLLEVTVLIDEKDPITVSISMNVITDIAEEPNHILALYPNPATNTLTIHLKEGDGAHVKNIQILSMEGKQVQEITRLNEEDVISINVSGLTYGIYLLQLNYSSFSTRLRFIKQ